jgi:hypothetical protein
VPFSAITHFIVRVTSQSRKLIPCRRATANNRLLFFNGIQSRVVIGFLFGHNTLRRHLFIIGLIDSPLFGRCEAEEETSGHVLCELGALDLLRHTHLVSFFSGPEDVTSQSLEAIWDLDKGTGLP